MMKCLQKDENEEFWSLTLEKSHFKSMVALLIITLTSFQLQAKDSPPVETISLVKEIASIKEVLKAVEKQTTFRFFYNHQHVNVDKTISINLQEVALEEALDIIFKNTPIGYKISGRQILLFRSDENPESRSSLEDNPLDEKNASEAEASVSGTVTSSTGESMPGVNVVQKGTTNGTTTDVDGKYFLSVPEEDAVLVFSFIGFTTQEFAINGRTVIDVVLTEDAKSLEEVVVVGYGTQKKVNLTGAITAVNSEELNNISSANLSNTLAGRAPGVNITGTSGLSGASSSIRIRGSFGDPLFVIDGVVRDKQAFDALQPNEVDQLSFLKDAATASIYGSRAGNGVVLVTTKQGTVQKPTFGFQTSYTISTPTQTLLSDQTTATDELIYQTR